MVDLSTLQPGDLVKVIPEKVAGWLPGVQAALARSGWVVKVVEVRVRDGLVSFACPAYRPFPVWALATRLEPYEEFRFIVTRGVDDGSV